MVFINHYPMLAVLLSQKNNRFVLAFTLPFLLAA
jgi:hypothetical protein